MNGLLLLRERIAEKCSKLYASNINSDTQITITQVVLMLFIQH
jgi:aspartate/methionine/tyrosine aminotransferase